jgi:putative glutamine amidotransferase
MKNERYIRLAVPWLKPNYLTWLRLWNEHVECIDFSGRKPDELERGAGLYDALILTGGGDLVPQLYGRPDMAKHCMGMDPGRDDLEWKLAETAFRLKVPVLGICRGLQLLNVFLGGTLCADIPLFYGNLCRHKGEQDEFHTVELPATSFLYPVCGSLAGEVNSAHHQAIQDIAPGLAVAARSPDGIIEAIEYTGDPAMLCQAVQWHPERMDPENPLSLKMGEMFLAKARLLRGR